MEEKIKSPAWNNIAEIELIYKSKVKASDRPQINTSKEAFDLFVEIWDSNKIELVEEFKVLFLNRANKVLGCYDVSSGGLTGTVADPRLIFIAALRSAACNIILCHN